VPIDGEAGVGYRLRRGFQVPPLMFDAGELQALVFGVRVAQAYGDPELARIGPTGCWRRSMRCCRTGCVASSNPTAWWYPASRCRAPRRCCSATCARPSTSACGCTSTIAMPRVTVTERIVWPLSLAYWGQTWTLGAWCELRQAFRSFRVDRIALARALTSQFPDEPGRRSNDYVEAVHQGHC
jgi:hypothetical protein